MAVRKIELDAPAVRLDLLRQRDQAVGLARHGRRHDDHVVSRCLPLRDAARDVLDPLRGADRGAAEFLDDEGHETPGKREILQDQRNTTQINLPECKRPLRLMLQGRE